MFHNSPNENLMIVIINFVNYMQYDAKCPFSIIITRLTDSELQGQEEPAYY